MARSYTIQCSLPNTHTVYLELDGGRQPGREAGKEQVRMEDARMGGSKGRVGREGARRGSEEATM